MSSNPKSDRHFSRLQLGEAAIISVPQTIGLIPIADGDARKWLKAHHLIKDLEGRKVVVWGDVLAALNSDHGLVLEELLIEESAEGGGE
jgi:hypothetical protein